MGSFYFYFSLSLSLEFYEFYWFYFIYAAEFIYGSFATDKFTRFEYLFLKYVIIVKTVEINSKADIKLKVLIKSLFVKLNCERYGVC